VPAREPGARADDDPSDGVRRPGVAEHAAASFRVSAGANRPRLRPRRLEFVNRRTYVALGGVGLLVALIAARLLKTASPALADAVFDGGIADARADAEPRAKVENDNLPRPGDVGAVSEPKPEPEEGFGQAAPDVPQASRARIVLALAVILALTALIVLLFLKEFLG
jgi:hypothetical protein